MKLARKRALVVMGTRPECIKLAPVINELRQHKREFDLFVCATAQHRELLDQVVQIYKVPVHYDLNIMSRNQTLESLTSRLLTRVSRVLKEVRPDIVLVQGDTTTAFTASLAAFYQRIPVAHVEAGLRTNDPFAPFPEEINRRLTTHVTRFHFAPTEWARRNLLAEGIADDRIFVTGNTVVDAFLNAHRLVQRRPPRIPELDGFLKSARKVVLVTAHRRENFGAPLEQICQALKQLATTRDDIEIVYPVHPNPNVHGPVWKRLGSVPRIRLLRPLEYLPFVWLMGHSFLALTDSGGIQEEMPSLKRPVLVMREKTERPEGVEAGVCQLVGTDAATICAAVTRLLDDARAYADFGRNPSPFGDGKAAPRIVREIASGLQAGDR
ncbi:MAG: UDP-N-acetylglucosamine 2-epimerase (non-hydrolyzing) [Acidobacteriia bacterium]|nr:UDP-N-acetylglucosamine 2-epimerase (non-hydrolyzing) [Terriglobia bacterium]